LDSAVNCGNPLPDSQPAILRNTINAEGKTAGLRSANVRFVALLAGKKRMSLVGRSEPLSWPPPI
jgi:hypothetical protein